MSPTAFFLSLLLVWTVLYIIAPTWLLFRGRLLSGGFVQLIGAILPAIWQGVFWPNGAGNFGLLMMVLVPIPLGLMAAGLIAGLVRISKRMRHLAAGRRGL